MLYGSISASYFIEQYGMPQMSVRQTTPETNERTELWNVPAEQPEKRLETLRQRIQ